MCETENLEQKKRFIESSSFYTNCDSANPFSDMKIRDSSFLDELPQRSPCPKCNKSRKYYCYTCYVAVQEVASRLPTVNLPVKIDIIKHPKEVDGKSTSAHAAVLAPHDVTIYTYPHFPSYQNEKVILIFPGKCAVPFEEWWLSHKNRSRHSQNNTEKMSSCDEPEAIKIDFALPFDKVIFIDSTWRQSKALYMDPRLNSVPCILLRSHKSVFWRPQRGQPDTHLATVEAVYYFLLDLHRLQEPYRGEYDELLFFFKHTYLKLKSLYSVTQ